MSKELEALLIIKGTQQHLKLLSCGELKSFEVIEKGLKDKEKKDKALEIIKEIDKTSLLHFIAISVKDQEKYEFLKEILLWVYF